MLDLKISVRTQKIRKIEGNNIYKYENIKDKVMDFIDYWKYEKSNDQKYDDKKVNIKSFSSGSCCREESLNKLATLRIINFLACLKPKNKNLSIQPCLIG